MIVNLTKKVIKVKIMNMPGFNAEASLYKAHTHFPAMATSDTSAPMVVPQYGLCWKARYLCDRGFQKWCAIEDRVCDRFGI